MSAIFTIIVLSGASYFLYFLVLGLGMRKVKKIKKYKTNNNPVSLSIIIPFRNELPHLPLLWNSIKNLNINEVEVEVIFIDDNSNDTGLAWLKNETSKGNLLPVKILQNPGSGKKSALSFGIKHAKFDYIVTTDADVILPTDWLQHIAISFSNKQLKMLVMPVGMHLENLTVFQRFQALEILALSCLGGGAIGFGKPITANGANLAFEKKAFQEVGGYYPEIDFPGGDDEFLLHRLYGAYPHSIAADFTPGVLVKTFPSASLTELIHQRKRWIAKFRIHQSWSHRILTLIPGITMLLLIVFFLLSPFNSFSFYCFVFLLLSKWAGDIFFFTQIVDLQPSLKKWTIYLFALPVYQMIYIAGILFSGSWNTFEWKNRKYGV